jgi:CRAL/TRIO domain
MTFTQEEPQYFVNLSFDDVRLKELYESGFIFPARERHANGSSVLVVQSGVVDTKKFNSTDLIRLAFLVLLTLLEESETQVGGVMSVFNNKNVTMEFLSLFSISEMKILSKVRQKVFPLRSKQELHFNVSPFALKILKMFASFLSEKLQNRLQFFESIDTLGDSIDVNILPKEYGGSVPMKDMIDEFKVKIESHKQKLFLLSQQKIIASGIKGESKEIGSFRKLEVD